MDPICPSKKEARVDASWDQEGKEKEKERARESRDRAVGSCIYPSFFQSPMGQRKGGIGSGGSFSFLCLLQQREKLKLYFFSSVEKQNTHLDFSLREGSPQYRARGGGEKGWQKQSCNHFALIGCEISLKRWGNLYLRVLREFFWLNLQVQYSIIRIHNKYHILYLDLRCASIHRSSVEVRFYSPAVNDSFSTFQWGPRFLYLRGKIFLFIIDKHRCLKNWNLNQNLDLSKISLLPAISGTGSSEFLLAFSRYLPPQPKFWK